MLREGLGATASNQMTEQMTNRSTDSVNSVIVTCFGAGSGPGFAMFRGRSLFLVVLFEACFKDLCMWLIEVASFC